MRAILINTFAKTIEVVEHDGSLTKMYRSLDGPPPFRKVDDINQVNLGRGNYLWVDGEGFLIEGLPCFHVGAGTSPDNISYYPRPLAGNGLILGCDETGENVDCNLNLTEIAVTFLDKWTTGLLGPPSEGPGYIKMGEPVLRDVP